MKIYLGADHAGFRLKKLLIKFLIKKGYDIEDLGTNNSERTDYPVYAKKVTSKVLKNRNNRGILICGSGTGMCIAANRIKGIRAVAAYDPYTAKMARHDNDSNVLCLRGRYFDSLKALSIVNIWLKEKFSGLPRHKKRVNMLK